jgi:TRAP-type C4-dicarboxylate transport system permease small subunit
MSLLKPLLRLRQGLVKLLEIAIMLALGLLVVDVVWQVVSRYVLRSPSRWSEELATMLLIWVSLLGASVAYARKAHLGVDYLVLKLDKSARCAVEIAVHLLVGFFAVSVMILGGLTLVERTLSLHQLSPAMGIEMGYVYSVVPISGAFFVIFALEMIAESWVGLRDGETTPEGSA